ncbi:MAG TPA: hotdog fold thioesterase [Candidatus Binatia bacterium]|nr:hotdog fold thioesterase [Candidatus Binatia bacterium]
MTAQARARSTDLERGSYAARLGARVVSTDAGNAVVEAPYRDVHANTYGLVHGGVAASLALWAGELAAWSSQRASENMHELDGRMLSMHVSYLAVARQEPLRAAAAVTHRGRETVHLRADVSAGGGRLVAQAALVYRIASRASLQPREVAGGSPPAAESSLAAATPLPLVSPFIRSAGIVLRRADRELAAMSMPLEGNQNGRGDMDAGALVGCIDTCAALACKAYHDTIPTKSTTLSLSVAFGAPVRGDVLMTSRLEARDGEIFHTAVEAQSNGHVASALVTYRFAE